MNVPLQSGGTARFLRVLMPAVVSLGIVSPAVAKAPEVFFVKFETTKGPFIVEVHRKWAPQGADRFHELVRTGFYNNCAFFRVVPRFVVQFGLNGDPAVQARWNKPIQDDPVLQSNTRGMVTFARTSQPHSRSTQVFINLKDNSYLDKLGFAPFAQVVQGMEVVDKLYSGYGDAPPIGKGPLQLLIRREGNKYLKKEFPKLDYITKADITAPPKKKTKSPKKTSPKQPEPKNSLCVLPPARCSVSPRRCPAVVCAGKSNRQTCSCLLSGKR